jgi:hypothetical protein
VVPAPEGYRAVQFSVSCRYFDAHGHRGSDTQPVAFCHPIVDRDPDGRQGADNDPYCVPYARRSGNGYTDADGANNRHTETHGSGNPIPGGRDATYGRSTTTDTDCPRLSAGAHFELAGRRRAGGRFGDHGRPTTVGHASRPALRPVSDRGAGHANACAGRRATD